MKSLLFTVGFALLGVGFGLLPICRTALFPLESLSFFTVFSASAFFLYSCNHQVREEGARMRDMKDEHSRAREEFRVSSRNEAGGGGVRGCSAGLQCGVGNRVGRDT